MPKPLNQLLAKIKPPKKESQATEAVTNKEGGDTFGAGVPTIKDIIAPAAMEVDFSYLKIDNKYLRTFFVAGYPRFVSANWLSPLINF